MIVFVILRISCDHEDTFEGLATSRKEADDYIERQERGRYRTAEYNLSFEADPAAAGDDIK
jgi:hypothetical protein